MLTAGLVIKYGPELYRVQHVNQSRAFIVPLSKKVVQIKDTSFDAERGGISISANSFVEIINDLERARDEMELAALEREVEAAKQELARKIEAETRTSVTTVTARKTPAEGPKPKAHLRVPVKPGGGWFPIAASSFKPGTLADIVWKYIHENPGKSTQEIVEGVKAPGAIAACVSRFHQSGLIEKR